MSIRIKHKNSVVKDKAPLPADLVIGELGINAHQDSLALYLKDAAGAIHKLAVGATPAEVGFTVGDRTTALTVKAGLEGMRMPFAMKLTSVRLAVATAPAGAAIVVDVKQNGASVFTTKPQIAAGAKTSVGGAVPGVVGTAALADNAEITIDVTQIGATTAGAGLEVWLLGTRA
jgi:hypothetical protein